MLLTRSQFNQKFKANQLRLAFVGMSNIGKSARSRGLAEEKRFEKASIDKKIAQKLGLKNEEDIANWLGMPYDEGFLAKQKEYLNLENKLTLNAKIPENKNFILDTTGSVIYLEPSVLAFLKKNFLIIHFKAPQAILAKMIEKFFSQPKPLVWGDKFSVCKKEETTEDALKKCYPKLLNFREKKYQQLADISLDTFRDIPMSNTEFWEVLVSNIE